MSFDRIPRLFLLAYFFLDNDIGFCYTVLDLFRQDSGYGGNRNPIGKETLNFSTDLAVAIYWDTVRFYAVGFELIALDSKA